MVNGIHQNKKNEILQIFRIFPEKSKKPAIRPPESSQAELFREVSPPEGPFEVFFQLLLKASVDNDENVILSLLSLHITKK